MRIIRISTLRLMLLGVSSPGEACSTHG